MTSRIENEINDYRDKIEKYLSSPSSSSSESNYIEEVKDILNVLIKITITIEVLRNTRIGTTIQDIKKRFNGNEIGTLSKQLLTKWKKDCEVKKPPRTAATAVDVSNSKSKEASKITIETTASVVVNHEDDEFNDDSHYNMLSTIRKNVGLLYCSMIDDTVYFHTYDHAIVTVAMSGIGAYCG
jgi:protoporphyrinogen oxidase